MAPLTFEVCRGGRVTAVIDDLAALRIRVFRQWPYLYDGGDPAYERRYLQIYAQSVHAAVIVARDGGTIVGASTCLPLADEGPEIRAPFERAGADLKQFFYFGESVLLPAYRGRGAGVRFFTEREAVARAAGADFALFCAVRREVDHPLRPEGWVPLDQFWANRGFRPLSGVACIFPWQEVGEEGEQEHVLDFWIKSLSGAVVPAELEAKP